MAYTSHTPGPWKAEANEKSASINILGAHSDPSRLRASDGFGSIVVVDCSASDCGDQSFAPMLPEQRVNARLIAAAPDHALICWAMCVGAGRWEPSGDGRGEFCINGLRYSVKLDEFGCPEVHDVLRAAILKAKGGAS